MGLIPIFYHVFTFGHHGLYLFIQSLQIHLICLNHSNLGFFLLQVICSWVYLFTFCESLFVFCSSA